VKDHNHTDLMAGARSNPMSTCMKGRHELLQMHGGAVKRGAWTSLSCTLTALHAAYESAAASE
jgi:hypothetical protein